MDENDKGFQEFLTYWFAGWMRGMDDLDEPSRRKVLHECGKACAHSYTVQIFREAHERCTSLDGFLESLGKRFPTAQYERVSPDTIKVTYNECGCDLVKLGLVQSPTLCECSAANLRENFEQSLGVLVSVRIESSILCGGNQCVLIVSLENEN